MTTKVKSQHPPIWPFPTYRGEPYKPQRVPKPHPIYPTAPPAPF